MSLRYKYNKASRIIERLSPEDLLSVRKIANDIKIAQDDLLQKADGNFNRCVTVCKGLCCQNIQPDEIISLWDFVYILAADRTAGDKIHSRLDKENRLFTADCIFLKNGKGPCLFPFNVRPEVCITTFCNSVNPVKKEIRMVKIKFIKLYLFILFTRSNAFGKAFYNFLTHRRSLLS